MHLQLECAVEFYLLFSIVPHRNGIKNASRRSCMVTPCPKTVVGPSSV